MESCQGVKSHQVVLGQPEATDRSLATDATVTPMPVVAMHPAR